jgi:hypothetical protein
MVPLIGVLLLALLNACCGVVDSQPNSSGSKSVVNTTPPSVSRRSEGYPTHGFTIPSSHPRLWWNPTRLAASRAWLASHPFTPGRSNYYDTAFQHVVNGSDCSPAVRWAAGWKPPAGQVVTTAAGSDDMRGAGETILLVFDWCYDQFTEVQRAAFIRNWNGWVGSVQHQSWGGLYDGTWMVQNNYFWGNLRNELEWGIVSYGGNGSGAGSTADNFIDYALNTRWAQFVASTQAGGASSGGVPQEGESYGLGLAPYMLMAIESVKNMGRDLWAETPFLTEEAYWFLYWTTPSATYVTDDAGISTYHLSMFNEEDKMSCGGALWCRNGYEDLLDYTAQNQAGTPVASYARQWLSQLSPVPPLGLDPNATSDNRYYISNYILASDPGGPATSYTFLPLDYWATGPEYGVAKTAWDTSSAVLTTFFGTPISPIVGHSHEDWGSFNIWRQGRWVMRETSGYSDSIAGSPEINGGAPQDTAAPVAHNVLAFTNVALGVLNNPSQMMPKPYSNAIIDRLQSVPGYFYVDADLTGLYLWDRDHSSYNTGVVGHVEREILYLRRLETTVVFDRILTRNQTAGGSLAAQQVVTSALMHCETKPIVENPNHFTCNDGAQVARTTVLVPTVAKYRVINEAACSGCSAVGQYRIEIDSSGTAQRYLLNVIQARESNACNLSATVSDSSKSDPTGGTFTVTLTPYSATGCTTAGSATTIVFPKTACSVAVPSKCSRGGAVNLGGTGIASLSNGVQRISYTESGPIWGAMTPALSVR